MTSTESQKKARLMDEDKDVMNSIGCRTVPKPIVAIEFTEDVPLRDAYIGVLKQKRDIGEAIKTVSAILPGFVHLKRCSAGRLLVAFLTDEADPKNGDASFPSQASLKEYLLKNNINLNLFEDNFEVISVPARVPKTKAQAKKASAIWPVNFHPDLCTESIMNGKFFNATQLDTIEACMKLCVEAAKYKAVGNAHCSGSAVVLDPNYEGVSRVLAMATSRTNEHPLWHAAMLAVDLVASVRGGGAWSLCHPNETVESGKRKMNDGLPLCYPVSLNNLTIPHFSESSAIKVKSTVPVDSKDPKNCPYLCTNYWIFLLEEPCPLCAMALLHSRVAMIFYGTSNESCGVLGSQALLHTLPGLNHRYKVWSGVLESECKQTAVEIA